MLQTLDSCFQSPRQITAWRMGHTKTNTHLSELDRIGKQKKLEKCNCLGNAVLGNKEVQVKRKYEFKFRMDMSSNFLCSLYGIPLPRFTLSAITVENPVSVVVDMATSWTQNYFLSARCGTSYRLSGRSPDRVRNFWFRSDSECQ